MTPSLFIFFLFLLVYIITSAGKTPYDYFLRLSQAFLEGKYYIDENPPWLSELIPSGDGKFYIVHPPMPAILLIPFLMIFKNFQQQYIAHIIGALIPVVVFNLSLKIKKNIKLAIWSSLLSGFGTIIWFLSSVGSSWYLGQITACLFLLLAIYKLITSDDPIKIGVFLGAAYLSRVNIIICIPFFIFLLKKKGVKEFAKLILGFMPFFIFNSIYNYIRFGTIFDVGYSKIPGIFEEPWYQKGLVNISYIPDHLKILLLGMPKIISHFPYIIPSWAGMAIWLTTPAFVFSLFAPIKEMVVKWSWISIFLISTIILSHGGTGFTQFGYRYAVDFYPFLFLLTIRGVAKTKLKKIHWILLFISIIVNLWGVLWINKFQWVSY
ncbi:MAG: hypothetical protein KatS3mg088_175 [Patescibacteria group bacterium]|nr:MAG: hypothetical protein KatS3mg088_175 [Patescibacteria group bacterium]